MGRLRVIERVAIDVDGKIVTRDTDTEQAQTAILRRYRETEEPVVEWRRYGSGRVLRIVWGCRWGSSYGELGRCEVDLMPYLGEA